MFKPDAAREPCVGGSAGAGARGRGGRCEGPEAARRPSWYTFSVYLGIIGFRVSIRIGFRV